MIDLDNNNLKNMQIKGNVRKIKQRKFPAFKKNGNYIAKKNPYFKGYFTKIFNDKGGCIRSLEYEINLKNDLKWDWYYQTFYYDVEGNILKCYKYNSDDVLMEIIKNTYNQEGDLKKSEKFNPDGKLEQKKIIKHDKIGNKLEYIYNSKNNLNYFCKYDKHGNIVIKYAYDESSKKKIKYKYKHTLVYGSNGKLIRDTKISIDSNNKFIEKYCTIFNQYGKEVETKYYEYNKEAGFDLIYTWNFNYDKYGNMIKWDAGEVGSYEYIYKYDNKGNWYEKVEKKDLDGHRSISVTKRNIKYFQKKRIYKKGIFKNIFYPKAFKKCISILNRIEVNLIEAWKMEYNFNQKLSSMSDIYFSWYSNMVPVDCLFAKIKKHLLSSLKKNKTKFISLIEKGSEIEIKCKFLITIFCLCKINMVGEMMVSGDVRALDYIMNWTLKRILEYEKISENEREKLKQMPTKSYSEEVFEIYDRLKSEFI